MSASAQGLRASRLFGTNLGVQIEADRVRELNLQGRVLWR